MSTFKNFVQCRVTTPITAAADSIGLYAAESPYTLPSEEGGLLVLTDSPGNPSKLEVISYTSRSALGLYGVTRGLEGTTALEWTGPVYCYQSLLAGEFKTLLDAKVDKVTGKALSANDFTNDLLFKLSQIAEEATKNATDAQLRDRSEHTGEQEISTVTGLATALNNRVDKEDGRSLLPNTEITRLATMATNATKNRADSENADKFHTHTWSQVTEAPATATRWPTLAEVTDKPTNYPTNWDTVSYKPIVQTVGTSTTDLMSQKSVTDAFGQPSMTGSATLNGTTDNTLALTGIVTTLDLETGDVIRIQYTGYNKLHSVESITNNNLIVVNYEHAGNRSNGSLKLVDQTDTVTITRIAKWHNAPIGMGQTWTNVASRNFATNFTNTTGRTMNVICSPNITTGGLEAILFGYIDGAIVQAISLPSHITAASYPIGYVSLIIPPGSTYRVDAANVLNIRWKELR